MGTTYASARHVEVVSQDYDILVPCTEDKRYDARIEVKIVKPGTTPQRILYYWIVSSA
jgi:hypothetical protein